MNMKSEHEWRKKLTPEEYSILRERGTEPAFSGEYNDNFNTGMYFCRGCGAELFSSEVKFNSSSGWPSFFQPTSKSAVKEERDIRQGMERTKVSCKNCGGHLGHVFTDGPRKTKDGKLTSGLRYCINSAALEFKEGE